MTTLEELNFTNSFATLPDAFYSRQHPTPIEGQYLVSANPLAARLIDLDAAELERSEFVDYFGGRQRMPSSDPLAALYAGHQFDRWVGDYRLRLKAEQSDDDQRKRRMLRANPKKVSSEKRIGYSGFCNHHLMNNQR